MLSGKAGEWENTDNTNKMSYENLGPQLKRIRRRKKVSFENMRDRLGISHEELMEFERGVRMLSWGRTVLYCQIIGVVIGITEPLKS